MGGNYPKKGVLFPRGYFSYIIIKNAVQILLTWVQNKQVFVESSFKRPQSWCSCCKKLKICSLWQIFFMLKMLEAICWPQESKPSPEEMQPTPIGNRGTEDINHQSIEKCNRGEHHCWTWAFPSCARTITFW